MNQEKKRNETNHLFETKPSGVQVHPNSPREWPDASGRDKDTSWCLIRERKSV